MSKELTLTGSLNYTDTEGANETLAVTNLVVNVAAKLFSRTKIAVSSSVETPIPLNQVSAPRWVMLVNRDGTNAIQLKVAASGAVFARLLPGEFALFPAGAGCQSPVAIAENAACQLESIVVQT